jgi:hypothetical protein
MKTREAAELAQAVQNRVVRSYVQAAEQLASFVLSVVGSVGQGRGGDAEPGGYSRSSFREAEADGQLPRARTSVQAAGYLPGPSGPEEDGVIRDTERRIGEWLEKHADAYQTTGDVAVARTLRKHAWLIRSRVYR